MSDNVSSRLTYLSQHQSKSVNNRHETCWRLNFVTSSLLLVLLASLIPLSSASSTCSRREYWDTNLDNCVPCTKCNQHEIVIRPCQRHMDTVCKPLNTIEIDWSKSMATEPKHHHHQHHRAQIEVASAQTATLTEQQEETWDWEMVSLFLAVAACLMFFLGTAFISINYIRQWRKIKKQFDNDIEGLSQQLMARLAMPQLESSTIFIDDPSSKRSALGPRQIEVRCVYLEDILAGKDSIKETSVGHGGNVYINNNRKQTNMNDHKEAQDLKALTKFIKK